MRKISVRDLHRHVHRRAVWQLDDHPFWRSAFLLTDPDDLKSLKECGIQEVWIDGARG